MSDMEDQKKTALEDAGNGGSMNNMSTTSEKGSLLSEFVRSTLGGLGMFAESYFIFAVGEFSPIWALAFSACYTTSEGDICNNTLSKSVSYVEIAAIIVGMISFGFLANWVGRRIGSLCTASIMFAGSIILAASSGSSQTTMIVINIGIIVFSIGVGGEYPLSSVSAAERYETQRISSKDASHNRGRTIVFTFAMQGWGTLINIVMILIILSATASSTCTPLASKKTAFVSGTICNANDLNLVWRLTCAIGSLWLLGILLYRIFRTRESTVWLVKKQEEKEMSSQKKSAQRRRLCRVLTKYYWSRLFGTTFSWFMLDVALYGNRLYQAAIVSQLVGGNPSLKTTYEYTLLNAVFSLAGYYVSAFLVDLPMVGRMRLQTIGFILTAIFFFASAGVGTTAPPATLEALYYLSSFFAQFANCTTFLLPAEIFPTQIRSVAHGISAASGKLGALAVTLVFAFATTAAPSNYEIFMVSAVSSVIGFFATIFFIPNAGEVELDELDERFEAELDGKPSSYKGLAVERSTLSYVEILLGVHRRAATEDDDSGDA
jgi:MFS family permease